MQKKIGIYTPYLDSFGGGERYMLTIAEHLSSKERVDLLLDNHQLSLNPEKLKEDLGKRLNLDLSRVNLVPFPLGNGGSFLKRILFLRKYDVFIYLTDGSIPFSTAKKSIIHFQVPFKNTTSENLWGKIKLSSWSLGVCNSEFTKSHIEKEWPIKCKVVYPPADVEKIKPLKKQKNILSVGRFASFSKSKKHEEMIRAFKQIYNSETKGWSLHLAGSIEGDVEYLTELKDLAGDVPVYFYPNLAFDKLMELYGYSSIYWHAAGFGETNPANMEHFGMTTVEAMAGGCVPIVINLGGQKEIVEDGKTGFLWDNLEELKERTLMLIKDEKLRERMADLAKEQARRFSKDSFNLEINKLIYGNN